MQACLYCVYTVDIKLNNRYVQVLLTLNCMCLYHRYTLNHTGAPVDIKLCCVYTTDMLVSLLTLNCAVYTTVMGVLLTLNHPLFIHRYAGVPVELNCTVFIPQIHRGAPVDIKPYCVYITDTQGYPC